MYSSYHHTGKQTGVQYNGRPSAIFQPSDAADPGGVGHDHVHYEALTKLFLLNLIILSVKSNKLHYEGCIVIIDDFCYC